MRSAWLRLGPIAVLMCGTAFFLHGRSRGENLPPRQALASFPPEIEGWASVDVKVSDDTKFILGPGDLLERIYRSKSPKPTLDLFIAYFPSQRSGDTFHSPQHRLPGSGWTLIASGDALLAPAGRAAVRVNRLLIENGPDRELVLY